MSSEVEKVEESDEELSAVDRWWDRNRHRVYLAGLLAILTLLILWPRILVIIEAGHRGAMYRTLGNGTVLDRVWGEGLHVIPPWDLLISYETRIQESDFEYPTLTRDGLRIKLSISVRYRPRIRELGKLHAEIGPEYYERVIQPEIKSALRRTVGDRTAFEIYSTEGDVLQQALKDAAIGIELKPIDLDDVLIKEIALPPIVREAIDHKHKQEQALLEYEFRLQQEDKEAERKRTEATGIRDYEAIIAQQGLSDEVLRWRGIEATLALAKSPNAKVLVIGAGKSGLPIILDATGDGGESGESGSDENSDNSNANQPNSSDPSLVDAGPPTNTGQ